MPEQGAQQALSISALRWRCRRGMVELDWMLERHLDRLSAEPEDAQSLSDLATLLAEEDDNLWDWLSGRVMPPKHFQDIVQRIRRR